MALWRNIGGLTTIAPGATHHWEYSYPPAGRDVGVAIAAPNILEDSVNIELVAEQQSVIARDEGEATGDPRRRVAADAAFPQALATVELDGGELAGRAHRQHDAAIDDGAAANIAQVAEGAHLAA